MLNKPFRLLYLKVVSFTKKPDTEEKWSLSCLRQIKQNKITSIAFMVDQLERNLA